MAMAAPKTSSVQAELPSLMSPSKMEKAMSEAFMSAISRAIFGPSLARA
jgi:hypothetical protein